MQTNSNHLRHVSSAKVATRCALRIAAMVALAMFSSQGFGKSLVVLLAVGAALSVIYATVRREPFFSPRLTHWEEGATYAVLCLLALWIF